MAMFQALFPTDPDNDGAADASGSALHSTSIRLAAALAPSFGVNAGPPERLAGRFDSAQGTSKEIDLLLRQTSFSCRFSVFSLASAGELPVQQTFWRHFPPGLPAPDATCTAGFCTGSTPARFRAAAPDSKK
jgi:hypothetical protein